MYQIKTDTSALPWSPTGWPGVSMKMLQQVESTGGMTGMMRMEAGSSIPAHSHTNADQMVFVIEGDLDRSPFNRRCRGSSRIPGTSIKHLCSFVAAAWSAAAWEVHDD